MNRVNLSMLQKFFSVRKKEAAGFMLMLLHLKEGDEFRSILGKIVKKDNNTFEIVMSEDVIKKVVDLFIEETREPIEDFFDHGNGSR